ncbi:MAG: glycosyltransferase [Candidatus Omnitrophica bacterium]|jgi:glycosyltransferase involved in cell wall biosynthesis|nr:glycosyltransferase [Candidatus Omnitrophota bacterium]
MIKVSLYVPCFNAEAYIKECLESIFMQSYPIDEVLIINDGSTDNTVGICSRFPVKIINHARNKGLFLARNTAFCVARNEFVASLDADCKARPDWLEKLMKYFSGTDVAGVGGKLIEKHNLCLADRWRAIHMSQSWGDRLIENPGYLAGSNNVYKRSAILQVGLYSETYVSNYEDIDISKRLMSNGFKIIYSPEACIEHLRRDTIGSALKTYWHWAFHHYKKPDTLKQLLLKAKSNYDLNRFLFQQDIKAGRRSLLFLDILLLFYYCWLDLCYYINYKFKFSP